MSDKQMKTEEHTDTDFLEQMSVFPSEEGGVELEDAVKEVSEAECSENELSGKPDLVQESLKGGESCSEKSDTEVLKEEIERLRGELELQKEKERENARMVKECGEFRSYFPDVPYESIPDEVWDSVKGGIPLAYSYALYEKKTAAARTAASSVNSRNSKMSSGALSLHTEERYFSPSEVRAMSREQVKANYTDIIESMRHWN